MERSPWGGVSGLATTLEVPGPPGDLTFRLSGTDLGPMPVGRARGRLELKGMLTRKGDEDQ